jgi:hypothetical protein
MPKLTAELVEAFAGTFLSPMYDDAQPTPDFHRAGWGLYASDQEQCAVAAPRGHAKSTALTHDYVLSEVLFRSSEYVILVSSNEEMAIEHLGDIARELTENEDLIEQFQIEGLTTAAKTDIIVKCKDGHMFRIIARGSGQKMRGRKWNGKRPGLIVCDDLEDDEQVENKERRDKFRRWFYRALKPALRKGGKIRIHGTILHEDSLLARIMKDKTWGSLFYRAHEAFDDFSNILWPGQFTEERLKAIRQSFVEQFDAAGYSQEYLNDPFDNAEAYLKKGDFLDLPETQLDNKRKLGVGCDFAVSKKNKANRTSFTVGGLDVNNNLDIIDQHVDRWDTAEWIDKMFDLFALHKPEMFYVEDGVIWKSVEPYLLLEMRKRNIFLPYKAMASIKDKATNGRSFQKRMRAQAVRFYKKGDWYAAYENELLRFTGLSDATLDDQFDSSAILSRGFDEFPILEPEDFMDDEELYFSKTGPRENSGRSTTTGY